MNNKNIFSAYSNMQMKKKTRQKNILHMIKNEINKKLFILKWVKKCR